MGLTTFIVKRGKLSEIDIDTDKNWQAKGITNIKQVAASMSKGDLVPRDTAILVRLPPGGDGLVLTSKGTLKLPTWAPAGGALKYYFPVEIVSSHSETIVPVDQAYNKNAPLMAPYNKAYDNQPGENIRRLTPTVALSKTHVVVPVDQTYNKNAPVTRKYDLEIVVGGAVAGAAAVLTDETAAAQNTTANDMTLLPAVPAVNDAYYFGHAKKFDVMKLNIGTQGVGVWTIVWEYWNGTTWAALVGLTDGTTGFTAAVGNREVSHTPQGDWATTAVATITLYWIRARVSAYTSVTTQPKGTQSWIRIIT